MPPVCLGVLLGGLAACAQIAGIDKTSGQPPDRVSLQIERVSIGATVVRAPLDLTGLAATYYVPDDTQDDGINRIDAELTTPELDTWSAAIKDGTPPLFYDLPDEPVPIRRQLELPVRNQYGVFARLEHPSPSLAPTGATLQVKSTLPAAYAATESFQLYTLGSWTSRGFSGAELPVVGATTFGPVTFPFSSAASISGRPLEKITTADAVMFLRYTGSKLTGVMEAAPFEQTGTDSIMGTMTAVPANQTLTATVGPPAAIAARYAPVRPAVPTIAMNWVLNASPGVDVANNTGPSLEAGAVTMASTGMLSVPYGNPFVAKGWRTVFAWATSASRTYTPAGQLLPITLYAGLYQDIEPTAAMVLDLAVGLPEVITVDGKPLSTDGLTITQPVKPVHVTFVSGITANTFYQLQLYELVPNTANTGLVQQFVVASSGVKADFTIPAEFLVPGKIYSLRAVCFQGSFPGIDAGDLRMRTFPMAVGYLDSGVFTVTP